MSRKIYALVTTRLIIGMGNEENPNDILENMDYSFTTSPDSSAIIEDTEIMDWTIQDSN